MDKLNYTRTYVSVAFLPFFFFHYYCDALQGLPFQLCLKILFSPAIAVIILGSRLLQIGIFSTRFVFQLIFFWAWFMFGIHRPSVDFKNVLSRPHWQFFLQYQNFSITYNYLLLVLFLVSRLHILCASQKTNEFY